MLAQSDLRRGILHYDALRPGFQAIADDLGVTLDFTAKVSSLTVGKQQQLELIKALFQRPRVLILDEPTAVLAPVERAKLMTIVRRLKAQGTSTILISHKLEDLYDCCDRAIVFRHGKLIGEVPPTPENQDRLVRMIVGADLAPSTARQTEPGPPALTVSQLTLLRPNRTVAADSVSFDLRFGEILGLCGVEGNGQSELLQCLAGMQPAAAGTVVYMFERGQVRGPGQAAELRRLGLAHIAEDRLRHAVISEFTLAYNWLLRKLRDSLYIRRGLIDHCNLTKQIGLAIDAYDVRAPGIDAEIGQLSGGNQQKFVLAREFDDDPTIIIAAHPTRGLDLRTIASVRQRLLDARARGAAILMLSADLDEVWSLADRIMVMTRGRIHGPVPTAETTLSEIGAWMTTP